MDVVKILGVLVWRSLPQLVERQVKRGRQGAKGCRVCASAGRLQRHDGAPSDAGTLRELLLGEGTALSPGAEFVLLVPSHNRWRSWLH